jgi:hypothetical protein
MTARIGIFGGALIAAFVATLALMLPGTVAGQPAQPVPTRESPEGVERGRIGPREIVMVGGVTIESLTELELMALVANNVLVLTAPSGFAIEVSGAPCTAVAGQPNATRCQVSPNTRVTVRTTVAGVARQATLTPSPSPQETPTPEAPRPPTVTATRPPVVAAPVSTSAVPQRLIPRSGAAVGERPDAPNLAGLLAAPALVLIAGAWAIGRRTRR